MDRYWDKTKKERAAMTSEQVESFLDVELMEAGVIKPSPLALEEEHVIDLGEEVTKYGVEYGGRWSKDEGTYYFDTAEQAQSFIKLNPMISDCDYSIGSEYRYLKPITEISITTKEFYPAETITREASQLTRNKEVREKNEAAKTEFNKLNKAVKSAVDGIWNDWYECQNLATKHQDIKDTHENYLKLSDENPTVALKFLNKAFSAMEIIEAFEWFDMPTAELRTTLPTGDDEQADAATTEEVKADGSK